jgi:sarcosine oxidase subunit beta
MNYDAIVIGAGISGASTAYHLRKAGAKTLLIERGEPASGGTGKSAAIIRQSYSTPLLVRLARASITMLENARSVLGRAAGFVQDGYCFVVSAEMLEGAKKNVAMQQSLGIVNEWSEGPGFPQHLPEINPEGIAGVVYEPHGGYADPVQTTEAFVSAFEKLGGEFRARTPVRRLLRQSDRITGVELDSGEVSAAHVVNAAGPWARPLAASASLDLPLRRFRPDARCRRPRSQWRSMPATTGRSGRGASSSAAAFQRITSMSIPTTIKGLPTTISFVMCKRGSSGASRLSPA